MPACRRRPQRLGSKDERREVVMLCEAERIRDGVERTGIEPVTSGLQSPLGP